MNTACQVKKHTNKSASKKNGHILRHGKDDDIIIYQNHKNDFSCNTNKKLPCIEKNIVKKITEIKNKINVYTKRLTEYINRGNVPAKVSPRPLPGTGDLSAPDYHQLRRFGRRAAEHSEQLQFH